MCFAYKTRVGLGINEFKKKWAGLKNAGLLCAMLLLVSCNLSRPIGTSKFNDPKGIKSGAPTTTTSTTTSSTSSSSSSSSTTLQTSTTSSTSSTTSTTLASEGYCSGGGDEGMDCGDNGLCYCNAAISKVMSGRPVDWGKVYNEMGDDDPRRVFTSGGSENIPVVCRAAKYWSDGDPAWFEQYLSIQLDDQSVGLFGRELFSPLYFTSTVGGVIAIREKAERMGHTNLKNLASRWLKAYWTVLALAASSASAVENGAHNFDQDQSVDRYFSEPTPGDLYGGYSVALPGTRAYVNVSTGGSGLQYILLSMALEHPTRRYRWTLNQSPAYYGGLCVTAKSVGYAISTTGRVDLTAQSIPAAKYGLTEQERVQLRDFINSNGAQSFNAIINSLQGYRLKCDLTIVRTNEGIISWFGEETNRTPACSRAKGGTFSASAFYSGNATISSLSRATLQNWPEPSDTWKEGNAICSETADRPKKCINIPSGNLIYKVSWPVGGNIQ